MHEGKLFPIVECTSCSKIAIPPLYVCRSCNNSEVREAFVSGNGIIYTHTTIRIAPDKYREQAPYDIAIVELGPKLRVTARIISGDSQKILKVGQTVVFDHLDEWGYWFEIKDFES